MGICLQKIKKNTLKLHIFLSQRCAISALFFEKSFSSMCSLVILKFYSTGYMIK